MSVNLKYLTFACLLSVLLIAGCLGDQEKKRLDAREKAIERREQALSKREEQIKLSEEQLVARQLQLDSTHRFRDSVALHDAQINGNWTVTMQCTETSCTGYAVGDTKVERWNISYDNNRVLVKAYVNKILIRTYTGLFRNNSIELTDDLPELKTRIDVVLTPDGGKDKLMAGRRTINKEDECRTVFALKAEKI